MAGQNVGQNVDGGVISRRKRRLVLAAVVSVIGATIVLSGQPSTADVTAAQGLAYNYTLNVGLFGGPPEVRGFGQTIPPGSVTSASPSVTCPPGGGTATATDPDGARGNRGPATIYGGIWPLTNNTAPPSGPQTSSITCQLGPNGFVIASTDVVLNPPGTTWTTPGGTVEPWPGGVGPDPFHADSVHSECRADETGRTGSTRIVNGQVVTSTDPITGEPATVVNIPTNPAPNTMYHGTLDHINPSGEDENFDLIINEQILNPDGSITVNAAHMFLNGPIAVGEMIIGSVTCGPLTVVTTTTTSTTSTSTTTTSTTTTLPTTTSTSTTTTTRPTTTSSTTTSTTSTSTTTTTLPTTTSTSTTTTTLPTTTSTSTTTTTLPTTTSTSTTTTTRPTTTSSTTTSTTSTSTTTTTLPTTTSTSTTTTTRPTTTSSTTTSTTLPTTTTSSTSTTTTTRPTTTSSTSTTSTTLPGPPRCNGLVATIVGTAGNDTIVGTPGNDVIVGLGGSDSIQGLGGNDTICGNDGNDQIDGGAGNDTILGGNGNDRLVGGQGNNALFGEAGADQCFVTPTSTAQTCEQILPQP